MVKLVVITDLHDSVEHVDFLREMERGADALIVCGDFTTFGDTARVQRMADAVRVEGVPLYFVPGNCDAMPADGALAGGYNLHGRVAEAGGWLLAGLGGALPCPSRTPLQFEEADYARRLGELRPLCEGRADRLILVSHQPPYGTEADCLPSGLHVGCHALRAFLEEVRPAYCLTGHIHEAGSYSQLGRTLVLNPGPFSRGNVRKLNLPA